MGGAEEGVEKKRRQKGKKAEKGTRGTEVRKSSRTVSLRTGSSQPKSTLS